MRVKVEEALGGRYKTAPYALRDLNRGLMRKGKELLVDMEGGKAWIRKHRASPPSAAGAMGEGFRVVSKVSGEGRVNQVVVQGATPTIAEFMERLAPALLEEPRAKLVVLCPRWPMARTIECGGFLVPLFYNAELDENRPPSLIAGEMGDEVEPAGKLVVCPKCARMDCEARECEAAAQMPEPARATIPAYEGGITRRMFRHMAEYAKMIREGIGHNEAQVAWYRVESFWRAYIVGLDGREDDARVYAMNGPGEVMEFVLVQGMSSWTGPQRRPELWAVRHRAEGALYLYYDERVGLLMPDADYMEAKMKRNAARG
jgi:hypothetical protein